MKAYIFMVKELEQHYCILAASEAHAIDKLHKFLTLSQGRDAIYWSNKHRFVECYHVLIT